MRAAAWFGVLCLVLAGHGEEFQFFLRNGDRLTGALVAEDSQKLTLTNAALGTVTLPLAQIQRREKLNVPAAGKPSDAPTNDSSFAGPTLSLAQSNRLANLLGAYRARTISASNYHTQRAGVLAGVPVAPEADTTKAIPPTAAQLTAAPPKPSRVIAGEIQAGADLGYGTKNRSLYTGRFKLTYSLSRMSNQVDYLFTYGQTDDELSANQMYGSVKTDYRLFSRLYAYDLFAAGYDEVRKIDYSYNCGPGVGYHLLDRRNILFNTEAGLNYQIRKEQTGDHQNTLFYRFAQACKWIVNTRVSFEEKIDLITQYDNFENYKMRLEASAKYALGPRLSLNLAVINTYDTEPAPGVEPNNLQVLSTIGVRF